VVVFIGRLGDGRGLGLHAARLGDQRSAVVAHRVDELRHGFGDDVLGAVHQRDDRVGRALDTLDQVPASGLRLNDLARVRLRLAGPLLVDPYAENRTTGAFVLVDEATNETVAAGMVVAATA